jgi:hypothetical protein
MPCTKAIDYKTGAIEKVDTNRASGWLFTVGKPGRERQIRIATAKVTKLRQ